MRSEGMAHQIYLTCSVFNKNKTITLFGEGYFFKPKSTLIVLQFKQLSVSAIQFNKRFMATTFNDLTFF